MKKKLIILYPCKFTEFEYFKFEIENYKKLDYEVNVIDLSNIVFNKTLNKVWKTKRYKYAIVPNSILEFYFYLKRNKENSIILNFSAFTYTVKINIILFIIRLLKIKQILIYDSHPSYNWRQKWKKKDWFISKLKNHKLNFKVYFFYFNFFISKFLFIFMKNFYEACFTCLKLKNIKRAKLFNSYDYSNTLKYLKIKKISKNYCLYLDNGYPYFAGDIPLTGSKVPKYNIKKIYTDIIVFFKKIESDFNCKVIIIPHPKYKSSKVNHSFNRYFRTFNVDNHPNALTILSKNAKFLLSRGSTANSFGVIHKKPIINFYSSDHNYNLNDKIDILNIFEKSKLLGKTAFNIKNYSKKSFKKQLNVSLSFYKRYLFSQLTHKRTFNKQNYKIITDYIEKARL